IVAITGQVGSSLLGTDAFQEADIRGVTMPITKHNFIVTDPNKIPEAIASAFHLASTGRPGPVLVDIPKDIQNATMEYSFPVKFYMPGYKPTTNPHNRQISAAVKMISEAARPVLYVGRGVAKAAASRGRSASAEFTGIPGMHGTVPAVAAMQRADLLVAIGARFDDRVTGDVDTFAPHAQVIHADVDPAEIGKIREVAIPIVGDAREVLLALTKTYQNSTKYPKPE